MPTLVFFICMFFYVYVLHKYISLCIYLIRAYISFMYMPSYTLILCVYVPP